MLPKVDLTGRRFGRFVAQHPTKSDRHGNVLWHCQCDCGNTRQIPAFQLRQGKRISCGCAHLEHGQSRSRTYYCWQAMLRRCLTPTNPVYRHYGGRGITVCERWLVFQNFLADMGEMPAGMELERENNNLGYSPGNCKWATRQEQMNNTRVNRLLEFNGRTQTLAQWAREIGVSYSALATRLHRKWSVKRALTT